MRFIMTPGIKQISKVDMALRSDCYHIVDQTRPGEAMHLYNNLREDVETRGHILFVFYGISAPLGFIKGQVSKIKNEAKVDYLFVDKKYQCTGIGTLLLKEFEKYCLQKGVNNILLYSAPTIQAYRFYSNNGYVMLNENRLMAKKFNLRSR